MTARKIVGGEAGSRVYVDDQGNRYDLKDWVDPSDTLGFGYGKGSHVVYDPAEALARGLIDIRGSDTGYRPTNKEWQEFDPTKGTNIDPNEYWAGQSWVAPRNYKPTLYKDETAVPFPYPEMEDEIMDFRQSRERPGPKGGFGSWGHKVLIPAVMAMLTYGVGSALGGAAGAAGVGTSEGAGLGAGAADLAAGTSAGAGVGIETASLAPSVTSAGSSALSAPVRNAIINAVLAGGKTGITTGDWRRGLFDAVLSGASSGINYGVGEAGNILAEGTKGAGQKLAERIVASSLNSGMRYGANNLYNSQIRRA